MSDDNLLPVINSIQPTIKHFLYWRSLRFAGSSISCSSAVAEGTRNGYFECGSNALAIEVRVVLVANDGKRGA
jgi:hypothetical protein